MFGAEKLKRFLLQRNQHFRKVSVNKTFTHVHARAKKMDVVMTFCLHSVQCKITFMFTNAFDIITPIIIYI